jgi:hypothetical protein
MGELLLASQEIVGFKELARYLVSLETWCDFSD